MDISRASVIAILFAILAASCLSRNEEEEETTYPAALTAGAMSLEEFPVDTEGVSGLGPFCRRVFECGCPYLFPDDISYCRNEVWSYSEEFCETLLYNQLPECQD